MTLGHDAAEKKRKLADVTAGSDAALGGIVGEDFSKEAALDRDQRESALCSWWCGRTGEWQGGCRVIGNIRGHTSGI